MPQPKRLLLFDIDGTLFYPGPLPRQYMGEALSEVASREIRLELADVLGKTDRAILKSALQQAGFSTEQIPGLAREAEQLYLEKMRTKYPSETASRRLLPGVSEFLEAASEQYLLGLVTGNLEPNARLKLQAFGLEKFFKLGAFGEDGEQRSTLVKQALAKSAHWLDGSAPGPCAILFGDTDLDVAAAKANALGCVLVLNPAQPFRRETDSDLPQPDLVIKDYRERERILSWLEHYFGTCARQQIRDQRNPKSSG